MTYLDKLKHPLWQKKRLEILKRDCFMCDACKDEETTLHVHHLKYTTELPYEEPNENLVTLCEHCHKLYEYYKDGRTPILALMKFPSRSPIRDIILYFVFCGEFIHLELMDLPSGRIVELNSFRLDQLSNIERYLKLFCND